MAKSKPKKIADVSHPNASAPSPNSKSVIITSRPLMRDPMMALPKPEPDAMDEVETTTAKPVTVHREKVILPQAEQVAAATAEPAPAESPVISSKPGPLIDKFTVSESIPDEPTEETDNAPLPTGAEATEATEDERRDQLANLVLSQKYFLPINSSGQKKTRQFVSLGLLLILVLGAVWFDIALDAELIQLDGVKAPTNFFAN